MILGHRKKNKFRIDEFWQAEDMENNRNSRGERVRIGSGSKLKLG